MISSRSIQGSKVSIDTSKLEQLRKVLRGKKLYVKVGVLGKSPTRSTMKNGMSNPAIGLVHEKGSKSANIPRRSFLDMPLTLKGPEALKTNQKFLVDALAKSSLTDFYRKLGVVGENVVQSAFDTGGFGMWPPISKAAQRRKKGSTAILIDTQQLRKSITSEPAI